MTHQQNLIQRTVEYLDSQKWKYSFDEDRDHIIRLGLNVKGKMKNCKLIIDVGQKEIQTFAVCPIKASKEEYSNVVEYITRANYGLRLGSFEFDYCDGEVRYHGCLLCEDEIPGMNDIERTVDLCALMMQRYGDGLIKNMMGYGDPEADIKVVEG